MVLGSSYGKLSYNIWKFDYSSYYRYFRTSGKICFRFVHYPPSLFTRMSKLPKTSQAIFELLIYINSKERQAVIFFMKKR